MFLCLILLHLLCLWSPFCRLQVPSSHCFWCLPPVPKVGSVGCVGFRMEGTSACVLVDESGSCLSGGQDHILWCVLGVCDLIMTLGSLSANGWGCVPVLLVVWHRVSSACSLLVVEWSWVLALRWRSLGDISQFDITLSWEVSVGPMS